jgi:hypothetical protein
VSTLRRVLYWEAGVWTAVATALIVAPRPLLVTLLGHAPYPEYGWIRIAGIQAFALALLMILVGQRVQDMWWFAWAFLIATAGIATVAVLNALIGLPEGSSPALWWILTFLSAGMGAALAIGLADAAQEQPRGY